ncbi:MAG: insulinase family protein [Deltaproteobacteria bacterium]|nr:insulinase family protein [Deltaproteobacteria bacterium]
MTARATTSAMVPAFCLMVAIVYSTPGAVMAKDAPSPKLPEIDGVRLIHVEDPDLGVVAVEVVVEAGSLHDPPRKEGLADLAAHMLLRGTRTRTYQQIMDQVNDLGATLDAAAQKEFFLLSGDFMPRYQDRFAAILADVLANPTFPADEFEQERSLAIEDIRNVRNDDAELARHFFARYLYRGHPLGRPTRGYLSALAGMKASDCADFWRAHVRRGNLVVVLAGAIDRAAAERFVRAITAGVPAGARERQDQPPPPKPKGLRILVVDKPERTQTQVVIGRPSLHWRSPDLFGLLVGNTAFGGTFTARLMREIREKRGWSYGASSSITAGRQFGTQAIRFFPANKDTVPAIEVTLGLLRDVMDKGLEPAEVEFARNHIANQFPFRLETARKRADETLADVIFDRPADFVKTYVANVRKQTRATVNRAISKWYDADDLVVTVVATAADLVPELKKLPGVTAIDVVPYDTDELPPL